MLRAGVCINCAEKTAALILESGPEEIALEPCSGACREAIELYNERPHDIRDCWLCDACALAGPGTRFAFPLSPQTLAFSGRSCIVF
jgi:hypothetical protein